MIPAEVSVILPPCHLISRIRDSFPSRGSPRQSLLLEELHALCKCAAVVPVGAAVSRPPVLGKAKKQEVAHHIHKKSEKVWLSEEIFVIL